MGGEGKQGGWSFAITVTTNFTVVIINSSHLIKNQQHKVNVI